MDELIKVLTQLQWSTLLALSSGYAGYFVSNVGLRTHHKTVDVTFSALVFGFFSAFVYELLCRKFEMSMWSASLIAFLSAVVLGGIWAVWGRRCMYFLLRKAKVSYADETPSALKALFMQTKIAGVTLDVRLVDGTWLRCNNLDRFKDEPNGCCVFGNDGDILMYVTHQKHPGHINFEENTTIIDEEFGSEITYLPRERIDRFEFRRVRT